jgi:outer membrane protein OmpA-like peptidoglycan-associated protein
MNAKQRPERIRVQEESPMTASQVRYPLLVGTIALVGLVGTGCATKKYVKTQIDPVTGRVVEVEKKTTEQQARIGQLETGVSQADEHAQDADKKAVAAGQAAQQAQQQIASTRTDLGNQISGVRDDTQRKFGDVQGKLGTLDPANYKQVLQESVLFAFNKSALTADAKQRLDQVAQNLQKMSFYTIEVEGFTDKTGTSRYNEELSQRRADAVVRYLTVQHQVPLRRIHVLGVGEVQNQEKGKQARKEARKVEMRVFAPEGNTQTSSVRQ